MLHTSQSYQHRKEKGRGKVNTLHLCSYADILSLRVRGYQASLGANPQKLNKTPFRKWATVSSNHNAASERILNDQREKIAESQEVESVAAEIDAMTLEDLGFAQLYDEGNDQNINQHKEVESK